MFLELLELWRMKGFFQHSRKKHEKRSPKHLELTLASTHRYCLLSVCRLSARNLLEEKYCGAAEQALHGLGMEEHHLLGLFREEPGRSVTAAARHAVPLQAEHSLPCC